MLIYNTTYTMPVADARHFVIWVHQAYIPRATAGGELSQPLLLRVLSHHDQETECMSLQFRVADSATLHRWYTHTGGALAQEMLQMFDERIVGFSTIMEVIDGE